MRAPLQSLALASWMLIGSIVLAAPMPQTLKASAEHNDRHGDALPNAAFQRLGTVQYRNGAGILTIAYSPDGKRIASAGGTPWAAQGVASGDRTIRIWDVTSGKEVRQLREHATAISCLAFSPDSKHIAASTIGDESIRIWEVDSDKPARVVGTTQNGAATMTFAYSPDGKSLALSRGPLQEIGLLDVDTGKETRVFGRHSVSIDSLTFTKDGKQLATKTGPVVRLWDIEKGEVIRLYRPRNYHNKAKFLALETRTVPIFSTAPAVFSPDGKTLAFEGNDATLYLFDVETSKEQRRLVHQGAVASASFSPDGKQILTGSHDNTVRIWDGATGKELQHVEQHFGGYAVAIFSPAGKVFATAGGDHTIRFWNAETAQPLPARDGHHGEMFTAAVSADGKTVISVGRDNVVRFWELASGRQLRQFTDDRDTFDRIAFAPDARRLATYSEDTETTRVWDLAAGKVLREFRGKALGLAFGPDDLVIMGDPDNKLVAWSVASGARVKRYDHLLAEQGRFAFSADLQTLGVLAPGGALETYDATTVKKLHVAEVQANNEPIVSFALSPDGSRAALMMPGGVAALWDVKQNRLISALSKPGPAFSNLTGSLCFSPDGRTLAITGAGNSAVVLWEVATGKERIAFEGHRGPLTFVAYAPDGKTVLSGSWDTTMLAWDVYGLHQAARDVPNHELDAAWKGLADADASQGLQAMRTLLAGPRQALPILARHLKPVVAVGKDEVARMIKDLDSDNFEVRQKGFDALDRLGALAEEPLRKALTRELSLEARRKVEQLLEKLREGPTPAGMLREIRALEVLEVLGTPEARAVLEKMAGESPRMHR